MSDPVAQLISIRDLATYVGQLTLVGVASEIFKRIHPGMDDGMNRLLMVSTAVTMNFIGQMAMGGLPVGGLAWAILIALSIANGFTVSLAAMKAVELVAERKEREIVANGQVERRKTTPTLDEVRAKAAAQAVKDAAAAKETVTPKRVEPPPPPPDTPSTVAPSPFATP